MRTPIAFYVLIAAVLAAFTSSCATIISGTTQAVTIDSNVDGATVNIEGNVVGITPFAGKIPRKKEATATITKSGYETQVLTLTTAFNPVAVLSIFWDYSTTDCLTGACWEYAPNAYYVDLKPKDVTESAYKESATVKAIAMTFHSDLLIEIAAGWGPKIESIHESYFADSEPHDFFYEVSLLPHANPILFGEGLASML